MLERVFAAADVERVAVGHERLAAAFLDEIGHDLRVVRAQERQIAELAEVQLDGDEFAVKVERCEFGRFQQLTELVELAFARTAAEVGKINFGRCHALFLHIVLIAERILAQKFGIVKFFADRTGNFAG